MRTAPRPFVFVLMPFSKLFDDAYLLAIKPACEEAGAYAERVDEQIFTGSILDRLYNQIAKADLLVADMSERNPNVFYEVGYAHALDKPTVLVTRSAEDIPFDLKHYPHIVYGDSLAELKRQLEPRVRWLIEHPEQRLALESQLLVRINGTVVTDNPTIAARFSRQSLGFSLQIEIQNKMARIISTAIFQVGLLTPSRFKRAGTRQDLSSYTTVALSNDQNLFLYDQVVSLYPEAWHSVEVVPVAESTLVHEEVASMVLRIYRDSGTEDFPFIVQLSQSDA